MRIILPTFLLATMLFLTALGCSTPGPGAAPPDAAAAAPAATDPPPPDPTAANAPVAPSAPSTSPTVNWAGSAECSDDGTCAFRSGLGRFLTGATPAGGGAFYTAHLNGEIARYDLADSSRSVVASGMVMPQGLLVADDRLYATHLNNFCDEISASTHLLTPKALTVCDFRAEGLLPGVKLEDAMNDLMPRVSAAIVSWRIDPAKGDLSDFRVELDRLPATGRDHSPNGLTFDDGWIYASIGHPFDDPVNHESPSDVPYHFDLSTLPRPDTAGSVIRFRPGNPEGYEVFATGLRNVYGISVADDGTVYAADNDSHAKGTGMAHEELNAVRQGGHYGYPEWGTNHAPPEAGVIEPVAVLKGDGATIAHASDDAVYVAYATRQGDGFVVDRFQYETWERTRFYRNADKYVVSIHEGDGRLYLFTLSGTVSVVDKSHPGPISAPIER